MLTTADELDIIGLFTWRTPEHAARHTITCVFPESMRSDAYACFSGFISLLMSDSDYWCHRTRNIGLCLKWNEGGAVGVWDTWWTVILLNSPCRIKIVDWQHNAKNKIIVHSLLTCVIFATDFILSLWQLSCINSIHLWTHMKLCQWKCSKCCFFPLSCFLTLYIFIFSSISFFILPVLQCFFLWRPCLGSASCANCPIPYSSSPLTTP